MRQVWRFMGECYRSVKSSAIMPKIDRTEENAGKGKQVMKTAFHRAFVQGYVQE